MRVYQFPDSSGLTATNTGNVTLVPTNFRVRTFQVTLQGAATAAVVKVYASNDGVGKILLNTYNLTTGGSDGFVLNANTNWKFFGIEVTSLTGTGTVTATATADEDNKG